MAATRTHTRNRSTSSLTAPTPSATLSALDRHASTVPQLDVPSALASLRFHVLTYLSDIEARLALLDFKSQDENFVSPTTTSIKGKDVEVVEPISLPPPLVPVFSEPVISRSGSLLHEVAKSSTSPADHPSSPSSAPSITHSASSPIIVPSAERSPTLVPSNASSPSSPTSSSVHTRIIHFGNVVPEVPESVDEEDFVKAEMDALSGNIDDDISNFVSQALHLLRTIRAEVYSHLPDVDLDAAFDLEAMQARRDAIKNRLSEFGATIKRGRGRAYSSSMAEFQEMMQSMTNVSNVHVPTMKDVEDWGNRFSEVTSNNIDGMRRNAMMYVPRLQEHLASLQAHMHALPSLPSFPSSSSFSTSGPSAANHCIPHTITELLTSLLETDTEEAILEDIRKEREEVESAHVEIARALEKSENGTKLIRYEDLPFKWKNNPWVRGGYRFIPLSRWPALLLSIFQIHNETANIHTHLLPLLTVLPLLSMYFIPESLSHYLSSHLELSSPLSLPLPSYLQQWLFDQTHIDLSPLLTYLHGTVPVLLPAHSEPLDTLPAAFFAFSAACCLFSSVVWHVFSGCADLMGMEAAARVDYIGIGWLISASVQSIVFYGFKTDVWELRIYTGLSILTGLAGSVVPFMNWFNDRRNKKWRIVFFLSLCFASFFPLGHLCWAKGLFHTLEFIAPISRSVSCYVMGLVLYTFHLPESAVIFQPKPTQPLAVPAPSTNAFASSSPNTAVGADTKVPLSETSPLLAPSSPTRTHTHHCHQVGTHSFEAAYASSLAANPSGGALGFVYPIFEFMCSHTLWHVFIVLAIRSHYVGLGVLRDSAKASAGL
ncbi:HlyIII-domain-containing protein [Clavulina sp. PMI_390]|nr:HlyIII-domain-containing protein [Clavulina sp. PMI_390]